MKLFRDTHIESRGTAFEIHDVKPGSFAIHRDWFGWFCGDCKLLVGDEVDGLHIYVVAGESHGSNLNELPHIGGFDHVGV